MPQHDDPVAAYLKKYGTPNVAPPPAQTSSDPVEGYLQKYGRAASTGSKLTPEQQAEHERRKRFGRTGIVAEVERFGAEAEGIAKDVVQALYEFGREAVETAGEGYRTAGQLALSKYGLTQPPDIVQLQETEERGEEFAKELVTFPYHAVKGTREVTQRALAGEDISPREFGTAWAGGAMGLLAPVEGARNIRRARQRKAPTTRPAAPPASPRRPPVPYELEVTAPIAPRAKRAARPRPELKPTPSELDAIIGRQQAELAATRGERAAPPAAEPGGIAPRNPLAELDDAIAQRRADLEALDAELAARKARREGREAPPPSTPEQRAPDELRGLSEEELAQRAREAGVDPALARTPPPEESFEAVAEQRAIEASRRALETERRKEQLAFEGPERRALPPERELTMGVGPESITPKDLADVRVLGGDPNAPVNARIQQLLDEATRRLERGERYRPPEEPPPTEHVPYDFAPGNAERLRAQHQRKLVERERLEAEREAFPEFGEEPGPALSQEEFDALYPQKSSPAERRALDRLREPPPVVGEIRPPPPPRGEPGTYGIEPEDVRVPGTVPGKMPPLSEPRAPKTYGIIDERGVPYDEVYKTRAEAEARAKSPGSRVIEHKPTVPDDLTELKRDAASLRRDGFIKQAEELEAIIKQREGALEPADLSGLDARVAAERARNEALEREVESIPAKSKLSAVERADVSPLDARLEAQRRANEALEHQVEQFPPEPPKFGTRGLRTQREELTARKKLPRRRELESEIRSLRATLRSAERTLQRYPESDVREIAVQQRNEALQIKLDAAERLKELEALKRGTPYKRPPPSGKGPMGPNLGGEGGFFGLPSRAAKPTPLSAKGTAARVSIHRGAGRIAPRTPLWERVMRFAQDVSETAFSAKRVESKIAKKGRELLITQRGGLWMKAALDSPKRIAGALYEKGPGYFDDAGNWRDMEVGSLESIIKPIRGDKAAIDEVWDVLVSEHVPEWEAQGRKTGIDPAGAAEIVAKASPKSRLIAAKMRDWMNAIGEAAVRSGALSRSLWDKLRAENPFYIPFERVFEEGAVPSGGGYVRGRPQPGAIRPPIKKATPGGSELPIGNPFETIPDYGARMIRYTDLHRAVRSVLDMVTENRDLVGDLATRINTKPLPATNVAPAIGELLSEKMLRLEGDQVRVYNAATNSIETWKLESGLADGLRALSSREWDFLTEIFGAGKKGVQAGVTTYNPFFWLTNFIRDNWGRPFVSGATKFPFQRPLRRMDIPRFRTMGGGFGVSQESAGVFEGVRRAVPGRGKLRSAQRGRARQAAQLTGVRPAFVRVLRGLDDWVRDAGAAFEEITRGAEYEAQKSKGLSDLEAYVNTQEALGNFGEHGTATWIRWLNHTVPFFNPRIQGLRTTFQAVKARPVSSAVKGLLTITIPTLAIYALNYDDQNIQYLRQAPGGYNSLFLRDPRYYMARAGYGPKEWMTQYDEILRMPKPFLPGAVFGTTFENALDAARDEDEHAFRRTLQSVGAELWQTSVNPLVGVPISLARNKVLGTGVPIVPERQVGRLPEEQVGARPNYTLQNLSLMLPERARFSPAKAHYALGQFFGTVGREIPDLMDILTQAERLPERRGFADVPGVSRFFARTPSAAVAPVRDIYREAQPGLQLLKTIEGLAAEGSAESVERILLEREEQLVEAGLSREFTQSLSELARAARFMEQSPDLTPQERRTERDALLREVVEMARIFHEELHAAQREPR